MWPGAGSSELCQTTYDHAWYSQTQADAGQTADSQPERTCVWHDWPENKMAGDQETSWKHCGYAFTVALAIRKKQKGKWRQCLMLILLQEGLTHKSLNTPGKDVFWKGLGRSFNNLCVPNRAWGSTSMAMNHVRIIDLSYSLSHSRCLLQRTNNTTSIYLVDQLEWRPHTKISMLS